MTELFDITSILFTYGVTIAGKKQTPMPTEFIVSRDKLESFLPLLGAEVTDNEHIRDIESQELVGDGDGDPLTTDEVGYLGEGSIEPVEDDFSSIVAHLSDRDLRDED